MPAALRCSAQRPCMGAVTGLSYSSTPGFPRCRLRQVSPCSPHALRRAQKPSCAAVVAPLSVRPHGGSCTRFHRDQVDEALPPHRRFHVAQHRGRLRRPARSGRRRGLHPPAPFAAAPALLEARGFSVCSARSWRLRACRGGAPACSLELVCCSSAACPMPRGGAPGIGQAA